MAMRSECLSPQLLGFASRVSCRRQPRVLYTWYLLIYVTIAEAFAYASSSTPQPLKPSLRQTTLENMPKLLMESAAADCSDPRNSPPVDQPNSKSFRILDLPSEIWRMILDFAVTIPRGPNTICVWDERADLVRLSQVCQQFRTVMVPRLYHTGNFAIPGNLIAQAEALRRFMRTISLYPSLGVHCRELRVHMPSDSGSDNKKLRQGDFDKDKDTFYESIQPLKHLTTLYIHFAFQSEYSHHLWSWLQECFTKMDGLKHLHLHTKLLVWDECDSDDE